MTYKSALEAIAGHRIPCQDCNRYHQPWVEKKGWAPTHKDKKDGHPARPYRPEQFALKVLVEKP